MTSPRKRLIATQFAKSLPVMPGAVASTGHAGGRRPADALVRLVPHEGGVAGERECLRECVVGGAEVEREVMRESDPEQRRPGLWIVPGVLHECERPAVELDRLCIRVGGPGGVARPQEVLDGALWLAGLREVVGEEAVDLGRGVGMELEERLTDT